MTDVAPVRVLLIGMMGAGKSTVGQALSERTGWAYRDNDEILAEVEGMATDELLEKRGRDALREAESRGLTHVLSREPPLIAGIAGGVIESAADRDRLAGPDAFVVYLFAPIGVLVERVGSGAGRPWLRPDPESALRELFDGRDDLYRDVSDLVIDTSEGSSEEHADLIVAALTRSG
jgi:shikimate kinase